MGFFSNRRNRIIEEEITNALLYAEGYYDTSIYWQAFEKFAQEHGGVTDKYADGGQDTGFEMITNGIEVKVMAIRDRYDGTASIKVQTLTDFEKEADEFAADFAIKVRGGIPKAEEIEDEDEDEDEDIEDGEHIDYYEDGQIESKSNYKDGDLHGKSTDYNDDGQIVTEYIYEYGEIVKLTSYEDGQLDSVNNYKDGDSVKLTSWHENGQIKSEINYKDKKYHGKWTEWHENGHLDCEFNYKDGEKHGKQIWYLDGEIDEIEIYKDGEYIGDEDEIEDEYEENKPKSIMDELLEIPGVKEQKDLFDAVEKMNSGGSTSDVMPEGIGEFGLEPTNPIPTNGVHGSILYLGGLRALDGSRVDNERIKTVKVENIKKIIDAYSISHENGSHITTIYISPYQAKNSKKAPKGLTQVSPLL
jgi:antitoxin component YwqK of YwqJK toxin-antitoxin module